MTPDPLQIIADSDAAEDEILETIRAQFGNAVADVAKFGGVHMRTLSADLVLAVTAPAGRRGEMVERALKTACEHMTTMALLTHAGGARGTPPNAELAQFLIRLNDRAAASMLNAVNVVMDKIRQGRS